MARTYRKRTTRKRMRKRTRKMNISKPISALARAQVYSFKRFLSGKVNITGSDVVPNVGGGVSFTLNDVPSSGEFTVLFDQYKIAGIAYRWVVSVDPMIATTKKYPQLVWTHDYDDAVAPSNFNEIAQYPALREHWFGDSRQTTRWQYIKPARAAVEYESAVLSAYRPQWKGFIDCASSTAPHNGIKYWVNGLQAGVSLFLQCRYYMVFKNAR